MTTCARCHTPWTPEPGEPFITCAACRKPYKGKGKRQHCRSRRRAAAVVINDQYPEEFVKIMQTAARLKRTRKRHEKKAAEREPSC